ncbi:MAG: cytochrome b N-terminal domain-containing protein [Betaproteobacteria bacterium]|nr:cytochrome b N-terminal domain-containing protein [Betaproteobacteria bacterium]
MDADPSAGGRPPPVLPPPAGAAPPPGPWRAALGAQLARLERVFDRPFGPDGNPWRHLGALGYFLFWIVAASGVYVYIGFDTRADGAYASVERMSANAFPLGSLARSLHRYASDAFVLVVLLHLVREWLLGRYAHFRRFSWTTGVFSLWLVYASGIGGYWLVWDTLAQYSLIATTEWLDALPFLGQLTRNFDAAAKVSDRLFSLLIFLHIGIPLALLATMWVHVQRLARPATTPPRALALGTAGALVALALGKPVASAPPADLATVPGTLALDWFYLGVHAFADAAGAWALWAVLLGATACLLALPWLSREARARGDRRGRGRSRQLQRLRPLLRRLSVRRRHDAAAQRRQEPPAASRRRRRPLRRLRRLRRCLPLVDPLPLDRRARDRHRPAAGPDRRVARGARGRAGPVLRAACRPQAERRRLRLRSRALRPRHSRAGRCVDGRAADALRSAAAAVVRRVRAAGRSRRRARHRLPRRDAGR